MLFLSPSLTKASFTQCFTPRSNYRMAYVCALTFPLHTLTWVLVDAHMNARCDVTSLMPWLFRLFTRGIRELSTCLAAQPPLRSWRERKKKEFLDLIPTSSAAVWQRPNEIPLVECSSPSSHIEALDSGCHQGVLRPRPELFNFEIALNTASFVCSVH